MLGPKTILAAFYGDNAKARALRGTAMTMIQVFGSNGLRLVSNLILTRILFPEAFGIMALTQIFVYGLQTFSNVGINESIIQSKRGDDPDFINTIWTIQIIRGFVLWLGTCLLAYPAALIYEQPILQMLLPVVGLTAVIEGFKTTREAQANRHLKLERIVALSLVSQAVGLVCMTLLALEFRSVWALAFGSVIGMALRVVLFHFLLPGNKNQLQWDKTALREIVSFGSFIFLSTIASFVINMGDRSILGYYLSVDQFGVYSIALLIGSLPGLVSLAIARNVLFPLYRIRPPKESKANQRNLFKARRIVSLAGLSMSAVLAFTGVWLIDLLYDSRYALAGPMVVLIAFRSIPNTSTVGTLEVLIANGDSRRHFYLRATTAVVQTIFMVAGIHYYGIFGAIVASGLATLATYPLRLRFTDRYAAWDPIGELGFMIVGFTVLGAACVLQWPKILELIG